MPQRQALGLVMLRLALGVFFVSEAVEKIAWLTDSGPLVAQLGRWLESAPAASRWYIETVALPGAAVFARAVPAGELATGLAFLLGVRARLAATLALLMVTNFHLASGVLLRPGFLTSGYALPVMGGLLALAIGGGRLPFSLRR